MASKKQEPTNKPKKAGEVATEVVSRARKPAAAKPAATKGKAKGSTDTTVKAPAKAKKGRSSGEAKDVRESAQLPADPATQNSATPEDDDPLCGLTAQEAAVVDHYLATYNQADAYIAAGYEVTNRNSAAACASRLLNSAKTQRYRAKRMKELMARNEDAQDRLLGLYVDVAYADPRELSEMHIDACRFCYGEGHQYQFTPQEFERYKENHEKKVMEALADGDPAPEFDPKGGVGYNPNIEPNPECPECFGRGHERPIFKDTRKLSPAAVSLYAGVKTSKDGIEIKAHSQEKARDTLAKIVKLYEDGNTINVNLDPADLEERFGAKMRAAQERMEAMRKERQGQDE